MNRFAAIALLLVACACDRSAPDDAQAAKEARLPPSDNQIRSLAADAPASELLAAIDEGLRWEDYQRLIAKGERLVGKGPDMTRFVVIRSGDRYGTAYRPDAFHVLVGAGLTLPDGALRIRREWEISGFIDGRNEELETMSVSVTVEPGAPQPFSEAVQRSVTAVCMALAERVPIHPDCVVAMADVPYVRPYVGADAERALAEVARSSVPVPPADYAITIVSGQRRIPVACELRVTNAEIRVGMMMRRRFDGEDRGMLFRYPHASTRRFWNRNVFIPIDLAYIRDDTIEQILTMPPAAGDKETPLYSSNTAVNLVLEMPEGWFERRGVAVGDRVELP